MEAPFAGQRRTARTRISFSDHCLRASNGPGQVPGARLDVQRSSNESSRYFAITV